jgi:hypothetical protein
MAGIRSNHEEVAAGIKAIAQSWDFRGRGRFKTLGQDALDVVAQGIYDRTVLDQTDPDGVPLAPLKPRTLARKRRKGYPDTIGVETGHMLDYRQLQGRRAIERRTASVEYGQDAIAEQEAEWFQEGSKTKNRPPRPFMDLDDRIEGELDDLFEEVLDRNLRDLQGFG